MGKNAKTDRNDGVVASPLPTVDIECGSSNDDNDSTESSIGIDRRSNKSKRSVHQCVILRRDHTIAFQGQASSRESLLEMAIRRYRADARKLFLNLVLDGFDFHSLDIRSVDLTGSSMRGLKAIELRGNVHTNLSDCDMSGAQVRMYGKNISMRNINLEDAMIDGSHLDRPDMRDARMVNISACEVKLTDPIMSRVVCSMGKFCRSTISGPDFTGAVFIGSDFAGMKLTSNELKAPVGGALEYLNDSASSQHSGCTVMSCNYSKNTVIEGGFNPFRSDRRVMRGVRASVAFAAAVATSVVVETSVKKLGLPELPEMLKGHYMPMALSLIAGMSFLRETASDEMKGAFKSNLDRVWSFMRKQARSAIHSGVDIYKTMVAMGSAREMRAFNIALMADGKKHGKMQILKSVLPGKKPLHVTICDRESAARAVEMLTRQYHRIGDGKKMTIVMPEGSGEPNVPTSMTLLPDGGYTATWFDETSGQPKREISVFFDRFGTPLEAYDKNGLALTPDDVAKVGKENGRTIIRNMVNKIIKSPDFSDKMAFDIAGSYLDKTSDGAISIRSVRTGKISNGFGPALYNANNVGNALYYKGGHLVTSMEGMDTVEKNYSSRQSLDDIVGERLTQAPATFPTFSHGGQMPDPAFASVPALPEPAQDQPFISPGNKLGYGNSLDVGVTPAPAPAPAKPNSPSCGM